MVHQLVRVYDAEHFVDIAAPLGQKFFYIARPCVSAARMNELTSDQNCAQHLTVSNIVDDFEQYAEGDRKAILEARKTVARLAGELNDITEQAYLVTKQLNAALDKHQEDEIKRERNKNLRQGIVMITSMLAVTTGTIFTVGGSAAGSGLDAGQALGAAFADVIANVDDYPKTCIECLRFRSKLIDVIGDTSDATDINKQYKGSDKPTIGGIIYINKLDEYKKAVDALNKLHSANSNYAQHAKKLVVEGDCHECCNHFLIVTKLPRATAAGSTTTGIGSASA